jgi:hypothetical protein
MIPVQYRDPETEEVLDRRYEEKVPDIGQRVMLDGVWECEVLYRWRCHPSCCVVYAQPVREKSPLRHRGFRLGLFVPPSGVAYGLLKWRVVVSSRKSHR